MNLVYLDQNVLVDLFEKHPDGGDFLPDFQIVLSPLHWIEAARLADEIEAAKLSDFIDSLKPLWLRERISIAKSEIQAVLASRSGDIEFITPICKAKTEVMRDLLPGSSEFALLASSWEIVKGLRSGTAGGTRLIDAYASTETNFRKNVVDFKQHPRSTDEKWKALIRGLCKNLQLPSDDITIAKVTPAEVRSITVQFEIAQEYWNRAKSSRDMRMRPQRQNDTAHISVALPYVDRIVSRDEGVQRLVECIRPRLPFPIAVVGRSI